MAKEPENIMLVLLREIRAKQDEHTGLLNGLATRVEGIEKQVSRMSKLLTYSLEQSDETQFLQTQQDTKIDELFEKVEALLSNPAPV